MKYFEGNKEQIEKSFLLFRAQRNPLREKILELLMSGEKTVFQLHVRLRTSRSVISQHLKILRDSSLVQNRRDNIEIYYRIDYNTKGLVDQVNQLIDKIVPVETK